VLYEVMGGQGAILEAALAYSNVAFGGIISVWMLNILGSVVRGTGNMSLPAMVIVGSVLGHMLISPALIFGWGPFPKLGPAGAGWGLVLSFGAGSLFLMAYLRSSASLVTLSLRDFRFQSELFAEFFRVGIPGFLNVAITNLTVVVLTSIAVRVSRDAAIGYAMGARLDYIMIPLAFGFGTAIVAMVGTNWGAKQFDRAIKIAWIGGATVAVACGAVGLFFAFFPQLWMSLFSDDPKVTHMGATYLEIVGPAYAAYGMGMALYFATQGLGRVVLTVMANGARLVVSAAGAALAVSWLDLGMRGFFMAIAGAFLLYAALTACALVRLKSGASK
jgi:Na+-driven multidrug efflux pump